MISKGTGYVKGGGARDRLVAHMKYIEHRSRDLERETRDDRRVFTKDEDVVSRHDAVEDIMAHEHRQVSYHKMVLSPGADEPVEDWREWTREVMDDLEDRKGMDLTWYAVKHDNTDNPHVHVTLAGSGTNRETGDPAIVKMYVPDYQFLDQAGHDHSEHEWYREVGEMMKDFDRQDAAELGAREPERDLDRTDRNHDRGFDFDR
ncbi:MAG: hypothetical protein ACRDHW_00035 [Ktedonobacteraceae bacterium]